LDGRPYEMRPRILVFVAATIVILIMYLEFSPERSTSEPSLQPKEELVVFTTEYGEITFQLLPEAAPVTTTQFKESVRNNYYVGCHFYRFEPGFVLQGGCSHRPDKVALPRLALEYRQPNFKGTVSMARTADPNSATSEFAIQLNDNSKWLGPGGADNFGYAVFMEVTAGWETINTILKVGKQGAGVKVDITATRFLE